MSNMLRIRTAQKEVFRPVATAWFIDGLVHDVRRRFEPMVEAMDDETLRRCVAYGVDRAVKREITGDASVAVYVGLMFAIAPHFDDYPDIRALIDAADGTPNERTQHLPERIPSETWQRVRESAGPSPWQGIIDG